MSVIVILLDETKLPPKPLMVLKNALNISLGDLRSLIETESPIFAKEIFDENMEAHCEQLARIIRVINSWTLSSRIFELPEGSTPQPTENAKEKLDPRCEIDTATLANIITQA
ncbi:MAG: hypothetical protein CMJ78_06535 [Planctomycetaceae bacterium]|nr:hypothetical protein [Planctomycetaceae bacterium]